MYNKELIVLLQTGFKKKNEDKDEIRESIRELSKRLISSDMIELKVKRASVLLKYCNELLTEVSEWEKELKEYKEKYSDFSDSEDESNLNKNKCSSSKKSKKNKDSISLISGLSEFEDDDDEEEEIDPFSQLQMNITELITLLKHCSFSSKDPKLEKKAKQKVKESIQKLRRGLKTLDTLDR